MSTSENKAAIILRKILDCTLMASAWNYRGAEAVEGTGNGDELSPPQPTGGLESVVSSPSGNASCCNVC